MSAITSQLSCYLMPGGGSDPRQALDQARTAESVGLGALWLGERFDAKDFPSILGAVSQVTDRIGLGVGITPMNVRHPLVLASAGQTLQALTGERFRLGFGKSADWRWRGYGISEPTIASMRDVASILRRLWAGETVSYEGPAGNFPSIRLPTLLGLKPPPLYLAAVGPKTLHMAGAVFDGVILHPFLTPSAVAESVAIIRNGAQEAGRDPQTVKVVAAVVAAPDLSEEETRLAIHARGAGYFQVNGLGDMLVKANGWRVDDIVAYRNHPDLLALGGKPADKALSREALIRLTDAMPADWIPSSSASGTAANVVGKLRDYAAVGADEILIHGSTADKLAGVTKLWAAT